MLEELRIQNFAIIDQVELHFSEGFNVITGETGAGKSILIDAVELLLGNKADPTFVRAGTDRAIIEGVISINDTNRELVMPILAREDIVDPDNPNYVTITREIRSKGRSSARINGITVNTEILSEVGNILFDIHGQSAHLSLFNPRYHIDLLDRYADLLEVRSGLSGVVDQLNALRAEMRRLQSDKDALKRRADLLRHEVDEIEAANLEPDEEAGLMAERNRLANSEQLATLAQEVSVLLNGDDGDEPIPVIDTLMQISLAMSKLAKIDSQMQDDYDLAESLATQAQELGITMASYVDEVEYDPDRLDELEERLEMIKSLKRRYSCETIADILAYAEKASAELEGIDNSEERLEQLGKKETTLLKSIGEIGKRLSDARKAAGKKLGDAIVRELQDLRMERTQFSIRLDQIEQANGCFVGDKRYKFDATGIDDVEFMMSANPGEPLRPLAKVASGGEAARIMLALKRVLTAADQTPILIFDEVDQGIGGRIGSVVGEKLWSLSNGHQVLVVTHLPQLAGYGDKHFHVRKDVTKSHAATEVRVLTEEQDRIIELAEMLGAAGETGKQSALGILEEARVRKMELSPM